MAHPEAGRTAGRAPATGEVEHRVRYAMVIDLRRCIGCHSCSVACKAENDVPLGVFRSWVKIIQKGHYPNVSRSFLPSLCNNCENPICLRNCPVEATWQREDGIVMVNPHRCIGCKYCMASCPYDVRHVNPLKRIVQKCTFCDHRVDAGLVPACVETCLGRARIFGDMGDPKSEVAQVLATNAVHVLKPEMGTDPRVFYVGGDLDAMDPMKGVEGE
jgi:tetrathionate reductase subunit B